MSLTASEVFDIKAPQCATDPNKAAYIEIATAQTNECWFGDNYVYAIGLRAAHMCLVDNDTSSSGGGSVGGVKSKKEGDLQIQYYQETTGGSDAVNSSDEYLGQTNPGKELLALMRSRGVSMGVTGMPLCGIGYPL